MRDDSGDDESAVDESDADMIENKGRVKGETTEQYYCKHKEIKITKLVN